MVQWRSERHGKPTGARGDDQPTGLLVAGADWFASGRRCTFRRRHQVVYPGRACGRSAIRTSTKDPVIDAQQYFFYLMRTDLGV
jgi:hypothetical protein